MAYTQKNYRTKAELRRALIAGAQVRIYQPNDLTGRGAPENGTVYLAGPHYPEAHTWYAAATLSNGLIVALEGKTVEKMRIAAAKQDHKKITALLGGAA